MKIAIFTDAFYPQINGVVTSIMSIAENMAKRGHKIFIVAPRHKMGEEYPNLHSSIMVKLLPSLPAGFYDDFRWTTTYSYSTYKLLRDDEIDIIHFMTPFFVSYLGIKIGRMLKIPVVGTFHTFISEPTYYEHLINGPITINEQIVWKYCNMYYDAADYVTAPTEKAVSIVKENGCTAPMEAISNGIDVSIFNNSNWREFKKKYNLSNSTVLFVGRIAQEKSITTLIDSIIMVRQEVPDAQLLLVGDGPQLKECKGYAQKNKAEDYIIFAGAIPHKELVHSGVFKAVSLFATASETETQGITVLEAQINGLITVGVNDGGVVDLIKDGVNGYLVEPGDTRALADRIAAILKNPEEYEEFRKQALVMAQWHDMSRVIDRWEELYNELRNRNLKGEFIGRDHLHFKTILSLAKEFKFDIHYYIKKLFSLKDLIE